LTGGFQALFGAFLPPADPQDIILIGSGQDVGLCMQTKELLLKWSSAFYEQLHISSSAHRWATKHRFGNELIDSGCLSPINWKNSKYTAGTLDQNEDERFSQID
jgi:hypothetical protein